MGSARTRRRLEDDVGRGFFLPIALVLFICLTSAGSALGILHGAPAGDYRRRNLQGILFGEYLFATLFSWYFVAALFPDAHGATTILTFAAMFAAIGGAVAFRSAGGTARAGDWHAGGPPPDRTADASWKAGMFYFAPSDPAIFIPRRTGIGYTLDFAQRWAWVWTAIALAVAVPLAVGLFGFASARHR